MRIKAQNGCKCSSKRKYLFMDHLKVVEEFKCITVPSNDLYIIKHWVQVHEKKIHFDNFIFLKEVHGIYISPGEYFSILKFQTIPPPTPPHPVHPTPAGFDTDLKSTCGNIFDICFLRVPILQLIALSFSPRCALY